MNLEEYRVGWEGVWKAREEREGGDWTPPPPSPRSLIIVVHHEQYYSLLIGTRYINTCHGFLTKV